MLSGDENTPTPKSGRRKAKAEQEGQKAEPRKRKSAQRQDPLPDQLPEAAEAITAPEAAETITALEAAETITAAVTSTENTPIDTSPTESSPVVRVASAEPRRRKSAQRQDPLPDQLLEVAETITVPEAAETITAAVTPTENTPIDTSPADTSPKDTSPMEGSPVVRVASAEADTVNYQTIANAYRKYASESLDQTRSFFEKLAGVRSLDKAFELQTEFAKQAYAGFVAEAQKIRELHGQLARQRLKHWEGFVARMIKPL